MHFNQPIANLTASYNLESINGGGKLRNIKERTFVNVLKSRRLKAEHRLFKNTQN